MTSENNCVISDTLDVEQDSTDFLGSREASAVQCYLDIPIVGDSASITTHKKRRVEAFGGGGGGVAPAPTTLAGPYSSTASVIVTSDRRAGIRLVLFLSVCPPSSQSTV